MEGLYCEVTLFQMIPALAHLREPFAVKCCVVLLLHCTFIHPWCYRVTLSSVLQRKAQCSEEVLQGALAQAGLSRALWGQLSSPCCGRMVPWLSPGLVAPYHLSCFVPVFSLTTTACTLIKRGSAEPPLGPWSLPLEGHSVPTPRVSPHGALRELGSVDHYLALASSRWYISSSPSTCCTEFLQKLRDAFYEELFQGLKPVQNMMFIIAIPV